MAQHHESCLIHPSALVATDVVLGTGTRVSPYVNLYGCTLGPDCMVGAFVEIQSGVTIGKCCRIQSHSFLCTGVALGDDVFVGHGVMFINDKHPSVEAARDHTWTLSPVRIGNGVSLGSGAIIMGGVTIGDGAVIGAGAVVCHDVDAGAVVLGIPARQRLIRRDIE